MPRVILHVDLDSFFCSVEEILDPSLRGQAFVVAGQADSRGVVSSASYPARRHGIQSAMPTARALRLLPSLRVVPARHGAYGDYSRKVMDLLREAAPVVEQVSVDEAFLDASDDPQGGRALAASLQRQIRHRLDLPTSWGVAGNRLVAKIATNVGKPNGLVEVPQGEEASFLGPLPVAMLWGVGPKTQQRLLGLGVRTIADLASLPPPILTKEFGPHGPDLASRARGEDPSSVLTSQDPRSISGERTFAHDLDDREALRTELRRIADDLGQRIREEGWVAWTVRLKLRWPDFRTQTRQARLDQPTDQDGEILHAAWGLFEKEWSPGHPIRLLGVALADLRPPIRQLELFNRSWQEDQELLRAVDSIRRRFGEEAVRRASELHAGRPRRPGASE